jgi:hypothetical protein
MGKVGKNGSKSAVGLRRLDSLQQREAAENAMSMRWMTALGGAALLWTQAALALAQPAAQDDALPRREAPPAGDPIASCRAMSEWITSGDVAPPTPPARAFALCKGRKRGEVMTLVTPEGRRKAVCEVFAGNGQLAAKPAEPPKETGRPRS